MGEYVIITKQTNLSQKGERATLFSVVIFCGFFVVFLSYSQCLERAVSSAHAK